MVGLHLRRRSPYDEYPADRLAAFVGDPEWYALTRVEPDKSPALLARLAPQLGARAFRLATMCFPLRSTRHSFACRPTCFWRTPYGWGSPWAR